MIEINAAARLVVSASWFDSLSEFQKKEYVKEHPNSKYAKGYHPSAPTGTGDNDVEREDDENDPIEFETLGSKVKSFLVNLLGGTPNRVYKNKNGLVSSALFYDDDSGEKREVQFKYTKAMLDSGKKFSPYGYWKNADTYVYMTKSEFKGLNKEQKRSLEDRQQSYGV
jgi:hypothetical protein